MNEKEKNDCLTECECENSQQNTIDLISSEKKTIARHSKNELKTVTMEELFDMSFPGKLPLIEGFLIPGMYLFVGSPKIGKSYMMAQIAYHVSAGLPMWGLSVIQGKVLYLALEDDYERVQPRLNEMFDTNTTPDLIISIKCDHLGGKLLDQLNDQIFKESRHIADNYRHFTNDP